MSGDLEIIKELEEELGFELPKKRIGEEWLDGFVGEGSYEKLSTQPSYGIFLDLDYNVLGMALNDIRSGIKLKRLPLTLFKLKHLIKLHLECLELETLQPEIGQLINLSLLFTLEGKIEKIPSEIGQLINLTHLLLHNNNITSLPPEIVKLNKLNRLRLGGNPLESPPMEIVEQGIEAVRDYFDELERAGETQYLFESKLLIIGDGGAGKTSFKRKIKDPAAVMPADSDTTRGIDVETWTFECDHEREGKKHDVNFHVNLWDFGGQELYRGTHQMFFSDKSYYVLLADTRKQGNDYSYWLNTVEQLAGEGSSVLILLNEKHGHKVDFDENGYLGRFGKIIKGVRSLDLSSDKGKISKLQSLIKLQMTELPGIGDPLPPSWVKVREAIAEERKKEDFISFDRFKEICAAHDISDSSVIKTLSGYYTRIGVFTHYIDDPLLRERIYLNSNWLLETVYKILEDGRAISKKGRLSEEDIKVIWKEIDFDVEFEMERLTRLMHKFGLMYQVDETDSYVVPAHLPKQPYKQWPHTGNVLHFRYEFDKYMPPGIMSRLIVTLHDNIQDHDLVWKNGVNLQIGDTHAEIVESLGAENAFRIKIVGSEKLEMLAIIREQFSGVLKPFKNLNYKQQVPCICDTCKKDDVPNFHEYTNLIHYRSKGAKSQCTRSTELVDVNELLSITEYVRKEPVAKPKTPKKKPVKNNTIELFLASSNELVEDRNAFKRWISDENDRLVDKGIYLRCQMWETALGDMSRTRKQDDYNELVKQSDLFVCLFQNKVGGYSEEEFDVAHNHFKEHDKPRIWTYFKTPSFNPSDREAYKTFGGVLDFQEKLDGLGHFYGSYTGFDNLIKQFDRQLDEILDE